MAPNSIILYDDVIKKNLIWKRLKNIICIEL